VFLDQFDLCLGESLSLSLSFSRSLVHLCSYDRMGMLALLFKD